MNLKDYYFILRDKINECPLIFSDLIEMDLYRTDNVQNINKDPDDFTSKMLKCKNILKTYCKRNPELGYCQGLNYIVWELLKRFDSEVLFNIFLWRQLLLKIFLSSSGGVFLDFCSFT